MQQVQRIVQTKVYWFCILLALAFVSMATEKAYAQTCSFTVTPDNASFGAAADNGTFQLSNPGPCVWFARTNVSWITFIGDIGGSSGDYTIKYHVEENTGAARDGDITIPSPYPDDNGTHTVHQAGVDDPVTTTTSIVSTTTSVPECTNFDDCEDGIYCNGTGYCADGRCLYVPLECIGVCNEERRKCISSWNEGEPCCITMSVFGEDSLEVKLLRRYRDEVLSHNLLGDRCISLYYYLSPRAVRLLDRSPFLKYMTVRSFQVMLPFIEWQLNRNRGADN